MDQQSKGCGGFLPAAEKNNDANALDNIKSQQGERPKGVADFARIHPDGNQGRNREKSPCGRQPTLNAANLARPQGGP
jgi:hypothetical protein